MSKNDKTIRGFKGFDKDLKCNGFQYEVGKDYEQEGEVKCCARGFHFCENPFDVFRYYYPSYSRYCEVEGDENVNKAKDDSKVATSHIHISAEIGLNGLIKAGVKFILDKVNFNDAKSTNTGYYSAAINTGEYSAAINTGVLSAAINTGPLSAATNTGALSVATNTGTCSAATNTGDCSAATNTGYRSVAMNTGRKAVAANSGNSSVAANTNRLSLAKNTGCNSVAINTGICSMAYNVGEESMAANTGPHSTAKSTGLYSVAINTGEFSSATVEGKESVAIAIGKDCRARGVLGSWIVLTEWGRNDRIDDPIKEVKAFKVDGVNIKENVFYRLVDGKPVEVEQ